MFDLVHMFDKQSVSLWSCVFRALLFSGDDIDIKSIMPPVTSQVLPLNIYVVIFGTGIFVFVLTVIFCCFFIRQV